MFKKVFFILFIYLIFFNCKDSSENKKNISDVQPPTEIEKFLQAIKYKPTEFEFKESLKSLDSEKYLEYRVEFPTVLPDENYPSNNKVGCYYFEPTGGEIKGGIVMLPYWKEETLQFEGILARQFVKAGYKVIIVPMSYQLRRSPKGHYPGYLLFTEDVEHDKKSFIRSILDAKRAAWWLVNKKSVPKDKIVLIGFGMTGTIGTIAFCTDNYFRAFIGVLTGAELADYIWEETEDTRELKGKFIAQGYNLEKLREALKPLEPLVYVKKELRMRIMLISCLDEPRLPVRFVRKLNDAFGNVRKLIEFPGGHLRLLLYMQTGSLTSECLKFIQEVFNESL